MLIGSKKLFEGISEGNLSRLDKAENVIMFSKNIFKIDRYTNAFIYVNYECQTIIESQ